MTLITRMAIVAAITIAVAGQRAYCDESAELMARFRSEAPAGWERLAKAEQNLSGSADVFTVENYTKDHRKEERRHAIIWHRQGDCFRLEQTIVDGPKAGNTTITANNANYFFQVRRPQEAANGWRLTANGSMQQKRDWPLVFGEFRIACDPATSLLAGNNHLLWDIAKAAGFSWTKASQEDQGIRVDFRTTGRDFFDKPFAVNGWAEFDPNNSWAMRACVTIREDFEYRMSTVNTFVEPDRSGLRRVASTVYRSTAPHGTGERRFTFGPYREGDVTPEMFRLAAFGLPDPLGPLPRRFPTAAAALGLAFVAGLIALWFRRRARANRVGVGATP